MPDAAAEQFASLTAAVVSAGGTVVLPRTAALVSSPAYLDNLKSGLHMQASLAYGQTATPGLHVMEMPTHHWVETLTGLGATGVEIMLAHVSGAPVQAHPMIPLLQVASDEDAAWSADMGPHDPRCRAVDRDHPALGAVDCFPCLRAEAVRTGEYGFPGVARPAGYFDVTRKNHPTRRETAGRREPACQAPGGGRVSR